MTASFPRPDPKHFMSSKIMIGPKAWLSHCAFHFSPLAHELCLELKGSTAEKDKVIFEGNEVESNYLLRSMVNFLMGDMVVPKPE